MQKHSWIVCAGIDLQLKESSQEKASELKKVNMQLKQSLRSHENELVETKELLELARRSYFVPAGVVSKYSIWNV